MHIMKIIAFFVKYTLYLDTFFSSAYVGIVC